MQLLVPIRGMAAPGVTLRSDWEGGPVTNCEEKCSAFDKEA